MFGLLEYVEVIDDVVVGFDGCDFVLLVGVCLCGFGMECGDLLVVNGGIFGL